jgi:hypothetical protein
MAVSLKEGKQRMGRFRPATIFLLMAILCSLLLYYYRDHRPSIFPLVDPVTGSIELGIVDDSEVCLYFAYESCGWFCTVGEGEILLSIRRLEGNHVDWLRLDEVIKRHGVETSIGGDGHCRTRRSGDALNLVGKLDAGSMMSLGIEDN